MDYAGPYLGHRFLVVIDAHSKWIEVIPMNSTTTTATLEKLRVMLFAQFGIPEVVFSDNGTNSVSKEFEDFMQRNGIKHVTSAPAHHSSNGLAENTVKTFKNGLSRLKDGSITDRLSRFLFAYRNTPHATTGSTPAKLMMGMRLLGFTWKTVLPPNKTSKSSSMINMPDCKLYEWEILYMQRT